MRVCKHVFSAEKYFWDFFHFSIKKILFIPRKMMFFVGNVMTTYYLKNKMLCTVK